MQYRISPHGGEKIGVIGLGLGSVTPGTDVCSLLDYSLEKGKTMAEVGRLLATFCL